MNHFDFEKLDVYQASIEVVVLINKISNHSPQSAPAGRAVVMKPLQHKIVITLYKKIQQAASHQITFLKHPLALLHVFEL